MDKFDQRKAELEAGYERDKKLFPQKEVTAESIVEDHERPIKAAGNLMLMGGKLKLAGTMAPILETARLRGQGIVPVDYKSVINEAFPEPKLIKFVPLESFSTSSSKKYKFLVSETRGVSRLL